MNTAQQKKFQSLYRKHVSALRRQGKAERTIDSYARAVRRVAEFWDTCPDSLTQDQLEAYFSSLVETHSWATVKVDRNGLQFFYQHVLKRDWVWVDIVKPPKKKVLPDILTLKEIERLINGTRELRYQTFILVAFSMGLRLGEALNLQVGDIDGEDTGSTGQSRWIAQQNYLPTLSGHDAGRWHTGGKNRTGISKP